MTWKLTEGALATIMHGGTVEDPVMQLLGSKRIACAGSSDRYRLLLSDGCHLNSFAMLATQLNDKLTSGQLSDYSVVRMNRLVTCMVNNGTRGEKCVLIILDLTILAKGSEVGHKIGNPVALPEGGSSAAAAPTQPARPAITSPAESRPQANGISGSKPAQTMRPPIGNNAAQLSSPADRHIFPIASLSPYQNKSTRVIKRLTILKCGTEVGNAIGNPVFLSERRAALNTARQLRAIARHLRLLCIRLRRAVQPEGVPAGHRQIRNVPERLTRLREVLLGLRRGRLAARHVMEEHGVVLLPLDVIQALEQLVAQLSVVPPA